MLTLEEIQLAKQGDEEVLEKIIKNYQKNFYLIKKHMFFIGGDQDDMFQEGAIGLLKAIKNYKFDENISFNYFANLCIKRQILSKITYYNTKKHNILTEMINCNFPLELDTQESFDSTPEDILIRKETKEKINKYAEEYLSSFENEIYLLLTKGYSYIEIAKIMEKSTKAVDNAIQRIRRKFYFYNTGEKVFKV